MKFEENSSFEIPKLKNSFIYFLIEKDEVVYVGKTTHGIFRPLSHKDKNYDRIAIVFVEEKDLDFQEGKYIMKYRPKYNFAMNGYFSLQAAKKKIRGITKNKKITIWDIKNEIKKRKIELLCFGNQFYISPDDFDSLLIFYKGGE